MSDLVRFIGIIVLAGIVLLVLLAVIKVALSLASVIVVVGAIFAIGYVIGMRRRSSRHH
jgi:Flp pilus assembly protein TadB